MSRTRRVFTESEVAHMKRMYASGMRQVDIADIFKISQRKVSEIVGCHGRYKKVPTGSVGSISAPVEESFPQEYPEVEQIAFFDRRRELAKDCASDFIDKFLDILEGKYDDAL